MKELITPYVRHKITLSSQAAPIVIKIFFPSTTSLWNDIGYDIRCLDSIGSFKKALFCSYNVPSYNATFDFAIDRLNAIFYTRLRLDTCALNYYLLK